MLPRFPLVQGPTPLQPLPRLSRLLGGPSLWVKRDDLTGLATGGNKTRKLEFLVADALNKGADILVTAGSLQSNHACQTAAAAARAGLECRLLLWNMSGTADPTHLNNGNVLLNRLYGAGMQELSGVGATSEIAYLNAEMERAVVQLLGAGRKPYGIPVGASNALGALGYVICAAELVEQARERGLKIDCIVLKSGSAGTHAGLVAGLASANARIPVLGIGGGKSPANLEAAVFRVAEEAAGLLGMPRGVVQRSDVVATDPDPVGYGELTKPVAEAIGLVARTEGILLDPVYTGRAMVGLLHLIRSGRFRSDENVVFLHTGGTGSLFGYAQDFQ